MRGNRESGSDVTRSRDDVISYKVTRAIMTRHMTTGCMSIIFQYRSLMTSRHPAEHLLQPGVKVLSPTSEQFLQPKVKLKELKVFSVVFSRLCVDLSRNLCRSQITVFNCKLPPLHKGRYNYRNNAQNRQRKKLLTLRFFERI